MPVHNNNRDGAAQNYIPLNTAPYTPNTPNGDSPFQANQTAGNGFFTAPGRAILGGAALVRAKSPTFNDVWSQPRMFLNSLIPVERQFVINAMRLEASKVTSMTVKQNVITQLNRVDNDLAARVAAAIGVPGPAAPDPTYYNNNSTSFVSIFNYSLPTIKGLNVGILASTSSPSSMAQAASLAALLSGNQSGLNPVIVAEVLQPGSSVVNQTYSASDASGFDGVVVTAGAEPLFAATTNASSSSTYYPAGRPMQILIDSYRWGKPIGVLGAANSSVLETATIPQGPGVYVQTLSSNLTSLASFVTAFEAGLSTFRFVNRFPIDP